MRILRKHFEAIAEHFESQLWLSRVSSPRLAVIPHDIDLDHWTNVDARSAKDILRLDPGAFYVLFFGRLSPYGKADLVPTLIAFRQFRDQCRANNARLLIAGSDYSRYASNVHRSNRPIVVHSAVMMEVQVTHAIPQLAKQLSERALLFPALSSDRQHIVFYTPGGPRMLLHIMDLRRGVVRYLPNQDLPICVTVGMASGFQPRYVIYALDYWGDECYRLYALDTESGSSSPLAIDQPARWFPVEVSPDGFWTSLLGERDGSRNIWRLDLHGTGCFPVTRVRNVMAGGKWSPDGKWTIASAARGAGVAGIIAAADGREQRQVLKITPSSVNIVASWSPSGRYLAFTSDAPPAYGHRGTKSRDWGCVPGGLPQLPPGTHPPSRPG